MRRTGRAGPAVLAAALVILVAAPAAPDERFRAGSLGGRAYRLYVPDRAAAEPATLVIALHGCWQTPEDFARGTRLNAAAERRGLLVLYPAQTPRHHPSRCWNWFEPAHQARAGGEVGEILALVEAVGRSVRVAPGRTVALGLSAGGFMAVNLLCAAPEVVSGIGVVAGGPYRCGLGPAGAMSCLRGLGLDPAASARACLAAARRPALTARASLWHGAADPVVAPANLQALETMLVRVTGAVGAVTEPREGAVHARYRDAAGQPLVESWLVPALGHAWPGGDPRGTHAVPWGPPATERMLDFLLAR